MHVWLHLREVRRRSLLAVAVIVARAAGRDVARAEEEQRRQWGGVDHSIVKTLFAGTCFNCNQTQKLRCEHFFVEIEKLWTETEFVSVEWLLWKKM